MQNGFERAALFRLRKNDFAEPLPVGFSRLVQNAAAKMRADQTLHFPVAEEELPRASIRIEDIGPDPALKRMGERGFPGGNASSDS